MLQDITQPLRTRNRDYNALAQHLREERDRALVPVQARINAGHPPHQGTYKRSRDFIWSRYSEALARLNDVFLTLRSDEL